MHRGECASRMSFACKRWLLSNRHDSLAERSKAVAQGAIPKGRGFEPHSCHFLERVKMYGLYSESSLLGSTYMRCAKTHRFCGVMSEICKS